MECEQIEGLLAAVADGAATPDEAARAGRHLESCAACRRVLDTQTSARAVLRARAAQLAVSAPPGLRTRIAASARGTHAAPGGVLGWRRLSAFGAAAVLVLTIGAALLPVLTERSTVLLAAQLALDHLKCFTIDGDAAGAPIGKAEAEAIIARDHGWRANVPASVDGLELVAVRRCLYGDGLAAHVLYRANGQPVSLFIMPGLVRPSAELAVLGHHELVWTAGDRTYVLVAPAGSRAGLASVASYLQNEAK